MQRNESKFESTDFIDYALPPSAMNHLENLGILNSLKKEGAVN